jgi:hypothetical protein
MPIYFGDVLFTGTDTNNVPNFDLLRLLESVQVAGGMFHMTTGAGSLTTTYTGTNLAGGSQVLKPWRSMAFEEQADGSKILKVATAGGNGAASTWEPLADHLGGIGGRFQHAQDEDVSQNNTSDVASPDDGILRLGVGYNPAGGEGSLVRSAKGLTSIFHSEIADSAEIDTIRFSLTGAPALGTAYTAANWDLNAAITSDGTQYPVLAWSGGDFESVIPTGIKVESNGTIWTTTINGNLNVTGTIDYTSVVQAATLSVADKFITLNDGFDTEYASLSAMNTSSSTGGLLIQTGSIDADDDDVVDAGEVKYKGFYWDAPLQNWVFADFEDNAGQTDYVISNKEIVPRKTNIVDLHFGDGAVDPALNYNWNSKFVTPELLSTHLLYSFNPSGTPNTAPIPDLEDSADNGNIQATPDSQTRVRFARIWKINNTVTSTQIANKRIYVDVFRDDSDPIFDYPPVVQVYRRFSVVEGSTTTNYKEQVFCNVQVIERTGAGEHDYLALQFDTWPGTNGLLAGDVLEIRVLY